MVSLGHNELIPLLLTFMMLQDRIDNLVQDCSNSSALAMELLES